MAKATVTSVTIETVMLELSREEAQVLADIAYRTGGDSTTTRRGLVSGIGAALRTADVHPDRYATDFERKLFFKPKPPTVLNFGGTVFNLS